MLSDKELSESAVARAWRDALDMPKGFKFLIGALLAFLGGIGALADYPTAWKGLNALIWFSLPTGMVFAHGLITATTRQRNEARREIRESRALVAAFKPRLLPSRVYVDHRFMEMAGFDGDIKIISGIWCAHVRFRNEPDECVSDSVASQVSARITWRKEGQVVLAHDGRWGETEQPSKLDPTVSFPIGVEHELNLAIAPYVGEQPIGPIYAFNNENYDHPALQKPEHILPAPPYEVEIWLRATNVSQRYTFDVQSDEKQGLSVVPIEHPSGNRSIDS